MTPEIWSGTPDLLPIFSADKIITKNWS